jgi:hypothetical protein
MCKVCNKCLIEKPFEDFSKCKTFKDGFCYTCKKCSKESFKKYYNKNKKILSEKAKNKEKIPYSDDKRKYMKEYYSKNKEVITAKSKEYYQKNSDTIKALAKEYNKNNKEDIAKKTKEYRIKNKKDLNEKIKKKKQINPLFRLTCYIRSRISSIFKNSNSYENSSVKYILGCSFDEIKIHIEEQFIEDMSWENYGMYGWHIDHIVPLSSAKTEEELIKLCHYTNLQPLWAIDNLKKGAKILNNIN